MLPQGPVFHKPKSFISAKNLVYTSICIGAFIILMHLLTSENPGNTRIIDFILPAGYVMMFFTMKQIGLCKKWARITLIIACVLVAAFYIFIFKTESGASITEWALFIFQAILQFIALIFLFDKETNIWLNSRSTETSNFKIN
jgi:hypothetical protein